MERIQKLPEGGGSVLGSLVRMEHQPIGGVSFFISFPEGCNDQFCIRIARDVPGNDFSGVQIHYNAKVMPFSADFNIGNIADPYKIRGFLGKVLLQMITAAGVLGRSGRSAGLVRGHFGQL